MDETRRHNSFGVDLSGPAGLLDEATKALNAHRTLTNALRRAYYDCKHGSPDFRWLEEAETALKMAGVNTDLSSWEHHL